MCVVSLNRSHRGCGTALAPASHCIQTTSRENDVAKAWLMKNRKTRKRAAAPMQKVPGNRDADDCKWTQNYNWPKLDKTEENILIV